MDTTVAKKIHLKDLTKGQKKDAEVIRQYLMERSFPFEGDLTNLDVWIVLSVFKMDENWLMDGLFLEHFPEWEFAGSLIKQVSAALKIYNGAWMRLLGDYIEPFTKPRLSLINKLESEFHKFTRLVDVYQKEIEIQWNNFEEEFGYIVDPDNSPTEALTAIHMYNRIFNEWFLAKYDTSYTTRLKLGVSSAQIVEYFLVEKPSLRPLYEVFYSYANADLDVDDLLAAYAILYSMPSRLNVICPDPYRITTRYDVEDKMKKARDRRGKVEEHEHQYVPYTHGGRAYLECSVPGCGNIAEVYEY